MIQEHSMANSERDFGPRLENAALELSRRISGVAIDDLDVDPYYRDRFLKSKLKYLGSYALHRKRQMRFLLEMIEHPERATMIDHGGGIGVSGILAKLVGFGAVIYNDIDSKMLRLAQELARAMDMPADHYVLGDFDELRAYVDKRGIECDALMSYDVIEHIYDMDAFIDNLGALGKTSFAVVMSSGANMFSPRYLAHVIPLQLREAQKWHRIRVDIIRELAPELSDKNAQRIAQATRHARRPAIDHAVSLFQKTGKLHKPSVSKVNSFDPFGTNVCHPETGWWAEHLMNPWHLASQMQAAGFHAEIRNGLYGLPKGRLKAAGASAANRCTRLLGPMGIVTAAYYTLLGRRFAGNA